MSNQIDKIEEMLAEIKSWRRPLPDAVGHTTDERDDILFNILGILKELVQAQDNTGDIT